MNRVISRAVILVLGEKLCSECSAAAATPYVPFRYSDRQLCRQCCGVPRRTAGNWKKGNTFLLWTSTRVNIFRIDAVYRLMNAEAGSCWKGPPVMFRTHSIVSLGVCIDAGCCMWLSTVLKWAYAFMVYAST